MAKLHELYRNDYLQYLFRRSYLKEKSCIEIFIAFESVILNINAFYGLLSALFVIHAFKKKDDISA